MTAEEVCEVCEVAPTSVGEMVGGSWWEVCEDCAV
jgi:hypothetical protein